MQLQFVSKTSTTIWWNLLYVQIYRANTFRVTIGRTNEQTAKNIMRPPKWQRGWKSKPILCCLFYNICLNATNIPSDICVAMKKNAEFLVL